ncbi:serralysin [Aliiruegeria haliotis]|uniref:Serralysin n=1 Tax=Aliiruegeria haliotis TaxID=1280846 RepID=A0A2T0S0C5_9RHOB|nr:M10 family metallopeptidase [Aliiruegeria haliotis]PRY26753.1 serralysin [Aliiruegeria haliotis]
MAAPRKLKTITFSEKPVNTVDPVYTFKNVWEDGDDLDVRFKGIVYTDSCAPNTPIIAGDTSYMSPVKITFSHNVSGIALSAGCFDNARSTRITVFGDNDFKVTHTFNPASDKLYRRFKFDYGENVIKKVIIKSTAREEAGFSVDDIKLTIRPEAEPVSKSNDEGIDSLIGPEKWASKLIKYSFVKANTDRPGYGDGPQTFNGSKNRADTQAPLTNGEKAMVRKALDMWDDYGQMRFRAVPDSNDDPGQLRFARGAINAPADAWLPGDLARDGDVTFNTANRGAEKQPGEYRFTAVTLHEVGHAIGLSHPHQRRGEGKALDPSKDSVEYSVMSYRSYRGEDLAASTGYTVARGDYPETPMINDIAAIQYLYGPRWSTNKGDTVYRFDPSEATIFRTIWDGGGTDTYDASAYGSAVKLYLGPGFWSSFKKSQLAVLDPGGRGAADDTLARGSVANAELYNGNTRSMIENAIGGRGNDKIFGNWIDNTLEGRRGMDTMDGLAGHDRLIGGAGRDRMDGGTGNDYLRGEGQKDRMTGNAGRDDFVFRKASDSNPINGRRDVITDFKRGEDHILLAAFDADATQAGRQDFTFIGQQPFSAAGQIRFFKVGQKTVVQASTDDDAAAEWAVDLRGRMTLTADDFIL